MKLIFKGLKYLLFGIFGMIFGIFTGIGKAWQDAKVDEDVKVPNPFRFPKKEDAQPTQTTQAIPTPQTITPVANTSDEGEVYVVTSVGLSIEVVPTYIAEIRGNLCKLSDESLGIINVNEIYYDYNAAFNVASSVNDVAGLQAYNEKSQMAHSPAIMAMWDSVPLNRRMVI